MVGRNLQAQNLGSLPLGNALAGILNISRPRHHLRMLQLTSQASLLYILPLHRRLKLHLMHQILQPRIT